jgi:hypothetical protein
MARKLGVLLLTALLLGSVGLRVMESRRADALLDGEARARATLAALLRASRPFTERGAPHPGLRGEVLQAAPGLQPLTDLGTEGISYAEDGAYMYALARHPHREEPAGTLVEGWVLRAWPLRFGATGDAEYYLTEAGQLWEGQNRLGRSGTEQGFPPPFPDPDVGQPKAPWWTVPLPDHM